MLTRVMRALESWTCYTLDRRRKETSRYDKHMFNDFHDEETDILFCIKAKRISHHHYQLRSGQVILLPQNRNANSKHRDII
jgi:hypothetical protein